MTNIRMLYESQIQEEELFVDAENSGYPISNVQVEQNAIRARFGTIGNTYAYLNSEITEGAGIDGFYLGSHNQVDGEWLRLTLYTSSSAGASINMIFDEGSDTYLITFSAVHNIPNDGELYGLRMTSSTPAVPDWFMVDVIYVSTTQVRSTHELLGDALTTSLPVINRAYTRALMREQAYADNDSYGFWFDAVTANVMTLRFAQTAAQPDDFVEVGRIMLGASFSPELNPAYKLSLDYDSKTTVKRTRSGAIITDKKPNYRVMKFELLNMSDADGMELLGIINDNGANHDVFIALYPDGTDTKAAQTSMLGRIMSNSPLVWDYHSRYKMKLHVEEGL